MTSTRTRTLPDRNCPYFDTYFEGWFGFAELGLDRKDQQVFKPEFASGPITVVGENRTDQLLLTPVEINLPEYPFSQRRRFVWRVNELSGLSIKCCPVCGESSSGKFKYDTEMADSSTLIGIYEKCGACHLYSSAWFAGALKEGIGFVGFKSDWDEGRAEWVDRNEKRKICLQEARAMAKDRDVATLMKSVYRTKKEELWDKGEPTYTVVFNKTALMPLGDFIEENRDYPLNLQAIKDLLKEE